MGGEQADVVHGNQDNIVDWEYNTEFLAREIAEPQIIMIEGANHQLLNESEAIRRQVINLIFEPIEMR